MKSKVIDLGRKRHARRVLEAYDKLERQDKRAIADKRAQLKRDSKNKF